MASSLRRPSKRKTDALRDAVSDRAVVAKPVDPRQAGLAYSTSRCRNGRCQAMRDEEGRAMLDELAGQLQRLGAHIADVADTLGLTAARIRDAFTRKMP